MKKLGFTLAEVLITLGIIGVVAALTAPALTKNTGQAKIGPSLSKFVNTFETACEKLMFEEASDKLSGISTTANELATKLSSHIIMSPVPTADANAYTIYAPDGSNAFKPSSLGGTNFYQLKEGSLMIIRNGNQGPGFGEKGAYKGGIYTIYYDINGLQGNNKAGREVFKFIVDDSGVLVPWASGAHFYLFNDKPITSGSWVCNSSGNSRDAAFSCTGKIADNGWKADY